MANRSTYLTDENGCYILTASGCRIAVGFELRPAKDHSAADNFDHEDEEIMLFITSFMETRLEFI